MLTPEREAKGDEGAELRDFADIMIRQAERIAELRAKVAALEEAGEGYYGEHNHEQLDADPDERWLFCVCGLCARWREVRGEK